MVCVILTCLELKEPVGQIVCTDKGILAVEENKVLVPPTWSKTFAWGYADVSCRLANYESDKVGHSSKMSLNRASPGFSSKQQTSAGFTAMLMGVCGKNYEWQCFPLLVLDWKCNSLDVHVPYFCISPQTNHLLLTYRRRWWCMSACQSGVRSSVPYVRTRSWSLLVAPARPSVCGRRECPRRGPSHWHLNR